MKFIIENVLNYSRNTCMYTYMSQKYLPDTSTSTVMTRLGILAPCMIRPLPTLTEEERKIQAEK